ncbi:extracellular ligand-binding receptor, partial [mine drainage metagenome]
DFGSVLTAPAVTVAEENKQLLFDETGTGATFFTPSNKYIVLTGLPTSQIWPDRLVSYLIAQKINKVAIVYCTNDFDASQDNTIVTNLKAAGITPVYNQAVANSTSNYQVLINDIAASHPQAVLELGFPNNDIPFCRACSRAATTSTSCSPSSQASC